MSFLSGLSNIFHGIGHIFDSQDDPKNKQQQSNQPTVVKPAAQNTQNVVVQPSTPQANPTAYNPNLNLTPLQKVQPNVPKEGNYDPNSPIMKAGIAAYNAPAAPDNKNSIGYKLTHNPVTDLAGSIVKPTGELVHAAVEVPHALYREVQNKPVTDIQKDVFGTADSGKLVKKIVGDTVNTALLGVAPGVDSLITKGASKLIPDTANAVLRKVVPKSASAALQSGAFGANSTMAEGGNIKQIGESAATNALVGGVGAGFFSGIPVLAKAVRDGHITPQAANDATKVADGVHTVNPNRPTDAAKQLGQPVEVPPAGAAVPTPSAPAEVAPAAISTAPVARPELHGVPEGALPPDATVRPELQGTPTDALPPNGVITKEAPPPSVPVKPAKGAPAPAPSSIPEQAPPAPAVTEPPTKASTRPQAPNAPGIRKAAQKKLDSLAGNAGDPTTHDVLSNQDLIDAGKAHADTFNDTQLVNEYKNGFNPTDAADVAKGHAALERLNKIAKADPKNKAAAKAIDNILAGAEQGFSKGGRTVNYAQAFYDNLSGPAKTSYLIRQIEKVRDGANLAPLTEDERLAYTNKVDSHVAAEEANKSKIATLEGRLEEIKAEAQAGRGSKELTKEANNINAAIKQHQLALSKNTSGLGKFYDSVAPLKQGMQQKVGDLGRSLMLSSVAGRGNDIVTTGINSAHQLLQQTVEAAAGKLSKSGKNIDTLPSPAAIGRGMKFGLQKTKERFKGNVAAGEASALLKKVDTGSGKGQLLSRQDGTRLSKIVAPIHRVVRSATEIATDLSEGIKESRIQQLAAQEGKQLGLKGNDLKSYTAATTASPSKAMDEAGTQLRNEVNNMQDNKISESLDGIAKSIGKWPVVGEQLRNMTLPFTRWTGGAIHNAVTDKNVIANLAQLTKAATKGDQQGMITAASKLAVNGVASIGAGYTLAKAGLITHENAQGYNNDGAYIHVGGRYIPAGFLGFFAPGLIMGSAAHDAMSKTGANGKHGSILQQTLDGTGQALKNAEKALGAESLTGESNPVIQALQQANKDGYGDVAAVAAGQVAGQYIPAATGDVNAVLNNGIPGIKGSDALNPTHEAALTKVEKGANGTMTKSGKPSTAKDVPRTVVNQLLNKIPGVSQSLPRNKGVAANDEFDRLTRGSRDTGAELKAKADTKTATDVAADFKKRGVPDPNATYKQGDSFDNAVENRVEHGKFDQAIEGLNAKLKQVQSGPDATTKQTDPIKKQIATIQVLKDGKYDPKIRDGYSHTSLSEWRAMGDPTSDTYDKAAYEELYNFDKALAGKGVSASSKDGHTPKYSLKDTSKADAKRAASAARTKITSNKLGSTPNLPTLDLSNLSPKKISNTIKIPTIQQVQPGDLIKKRAISVSRTR